MRVLLDQGIPYSTTRHLRVLGWDVLHTVDIGMERSTDRDIIRYACSDERFCVTLDSDFHSIIAVSGASAPSVIRLRLQGFSGLRIAELLHEIYPQIASKLLEGALITVTERSVRVRCLPI